MDIMCPRCGEPWDNDELHEEASHRQEEGLNSSYATVAADFRVRGCGAFTAYGAECNAEALGSGRAAAASALYDLLGDDMDGAAAMLDDGAYLGLF